MKNMGSSIFNKLVSKKNKKVYLVVEISGNHQGSYKKLKQLVLSAIRNGADIIKFQVYNADTITINAKSKDFKLKNFENKNFYELYNSAHTPWNWIRRISKILNKKKVPWFSSVFDNSSVDFLEKIKCPAYKIASAEITDVNLIEYVCKKKKPIILSTGLSEDKDLKLALRTIKKYHNKYAILKCSTSYPATYDELNLSAINYLKNKYKCSVGYSDHSKGELAAKIAVSLGATIIEKHFKLDKDNKSIDSFFSSKISTLKSLKNQIKNVLVMLGEPKLKIVKGSLKNFKFRRSLYVCKNIKKGEKFDKLNIRSIRPGHGMHPRYLKVILGKKSKMDIKFGTPLKKAHIKNLS